MSHNLTTHEQQIADLCLQNIRALDGFQAEISKKRLPNGRHEHRLRLKGVWGEACYSVEIRHRLTLKTVDLVINQIKNPASANSRFVLLIDYVHPGLADTLKRSKTEFIDTAGNIYLNHSPLYIDIEGRKKTVETQRAKRAFQAAGLKLIFLLLSRPEAVNWNYRELASEAGIALGTVGGVLADLREMGYLRLVSQGRQKFANIYDLLNRWEIGYAELLRPKLLLQTCRFVGATSLEELIPLIRKHGDSGEIFVGGELGAAMLSNQLRPEQVTLYIKDEILQKKNLLRLLPHENGNVEMVQIFGNMNGWQRVENGNLALADPVLIHAELLRENSERLKEIAQLIFDKYISPRFNRD